MNHLTLAHTLWKSHLNGSCSILDATCGNGHDTLFLAQEGLKHPESRLYGLDIQKSAIEATKRRLSTHLHPEKLAQIELRAVSHAPLPPDFPPFDLIVYNLGYLPGSDKSITTLTETTLKSIESSLDHLTPEGLISIMLYPGHEEGKKEQVAILEYLETLDPARYTFFLHSRPTKPNSPSLIALQSTIF